MSVFIVSILSHVLVSNTFAFDAVKKGPGGEVIIYYKDKGRNEVVIRKCKGEYEGIKSRGDCKADGEENRVPVAKFMEGLLSETKLGLGLQMANAEKESQDLVKEYERLQKSLQEYRVALPKVLAWAAEPSTGCDEMCRDKRIELQKKIESLPALIKPNEQRQKDVSAKLAKLKLELEKAKTSARELVENKIDSDDFHVVSSALDKTGQFELLQQYDSSLPECGTEQSIQRIRATPESRRGIASKELDAGTRMNDCERLPNSSMTQKNEKTGQTAVWKLVSRIKNPDSKRYIEVWQDSRPNSKGEMLLWTRLSGGIFLSHKNAVEYCNSNEFLSSFGKEIGKKFGLPSDADLARAFEDGIQGLTKRRNDEHEDVEGEFWTSSGTIWNYVPIATEVYKTVGKNGTADTSVTFAGKQSNVRTTILPVLCAGR